VLIPKVESAYGAGVVELSQRVPTQLPLLDALVAERADAEPLRGVTAVLIQHQLGSIVPMVGALFALGLEPGRTLFVDIPYSANAEVREALQRIGLPPANFASGTYHLDQPYAKFQRRRVQNLAADVLAELSADDPLLVLDDGAYFVEAASCFARSFGDLRVVEQTTRGIIKLHADAAMSRYVTSLPLVDVARSKPKARWEGPWIGEAVCQALHRALGEEFSVGPEQRVLLAGYGVIGRAVAVSLTREIGIPSSRIHVLDPAPGAQNDAVADGLIPWDRECADPVRFKLVVGCSGQASFGIGDRVFLEDGAVLASASSGSAECSREQFVELADTHPSDDIEVLDRETLGTRSIHDPIDVRLVDRTARFLNGGFPVNFDGRVNCVPPERIQVTRALMIGAALQAVETDEHGIVPLSKEVCAWVDRTYADLVSL
jgi:S-adenosylhomocysteine hydrolase